ncbi:MAG: DUF2384 domain-containing protein [Limimaricola sp.]|uniref:XRE family transcriptional regulator n=1 Tax=Limimaricola sp. TaxID=2211665 RepID=UPI001D7F1C8B|nr:XRE family transcriptional regulator [Limimaricola sp.]MBI1416282.1 DUF2384 domain-containing protein [Limimaricola sp.]
MPSAASFANESAAPVADVSHDPGRVVAKAVVRAAGELGLSQQELAKIIGVSAATASRMKDGQYALTGKPLELATCLIRVFRSLDSMTGGEKAVMMAWMHNANTDLGGVPAGLVATVPGLIGVMNYLDAVRAPV